MVDLFKAALATVFASFEPKEDGVFQDQTGVAEFGLSHKGSTLMSNVERARPVHAQRRPILFQTLRIHAAT